MTLQFYLSENHGTVVAHPKELNSYSNGTKSQQEVKIEKLQFSLRRQKKLYEVTQV